MENETFTCNEFDKILMQNVNVREKLANISYYFEHKLNIKIYFCKIFNKRWSFFAGTESVVNENKRIIINDNFGMIIQNNNLTNEKWKDFIECINPILHFND